MSSTIKLKDNVRITTGKERGKSGVVERIDWLKGRAWIAGLNLVKRHQKPSANDRRGGIIDKPASINLSNLMLVCPHCQKTTRIGHKLVNGKMRRICQHCKEQLDA